MVFHEIERKIIFNVYCLMKKEAITSTADDSKQCMKRTAAATKTSERTVRRIVKEAKNSEFIVFQTPGRNKRMRQKPVTDIDNFDKGVIRRIIHNFHITERELPTIEKIRRKLQNDMNFQGSEASLRRILKDLGFTWKRTENKRKLLIEISQIRLQRIEYLQKIRQYRQEGRPIIYTDESYIDRSHAAQHSWSDMASKEVKKPISKGNRLVIVHAAAETGFVPNSLLMFKADTKPGDNHDIINYESYNKWLNTQLIPNLPANAVVVVDNMSYHNKQCEAAPTSDSRKADMQAWLAQKGITFDQAMLKPQLYALIKRHKNEYKTFIIDKILNENGHTVLRLPPCHPDLNPFEMAWPQIKEYVASRITDWNIARVTELVNEKVSMMGENEWAKLCSDVKSIEEEYRINDHVIDKMTETFIVCVSDNDSDDESSGDSSSEDCSDDQTASSSTNTASSSGFHVVQDDLMEGESP